MANFFEDHKGNKSSNRGHFYMITIWAMFMSSFILIFGDHSEMVTIAGASAGFFTAIVGPAMVYMYNQKKNELNMDKK